MQNAGLNIHLKENEVMHFIGTPNFLLMQDAASTITRKNTFFNREITGNSAGSSREFGC